MTKDEAIKYLQQIYPNGGHCWLDEQRIEAIGMAVKALQEEPVSEDFTKALAECIHKAQCSVIDPLAHAEIWKEELVKLVKCEEPVSEDLLSKVDKQAKCIWDEINTGHEYSIIDSYNQFYGICMQIAESIKEEPVSEELEEVSKEWLRPQLDKSYVNYGEAKMMELTHFDGYAMLDAIEFGAKWQKKKDDREIKMVRELLADFDKHCDEYHEAGFKHGQEALMKDAVEAVCDVTIHTKGDEVQYSVLYPVGKRPFHKGDKVKVIVIKED